MSFESSYIKTIWISVLFAGAATTLASRNEAALCILRGKSQQKLTKTSRHETVFMSGTYTSGTRNVIFGGTALTQRTVDVARAIAQLPEASGDRRVTATALEIKMSTFGAIHL